MRTGSKLPAKDKPKTLEGVVEADETYVLESQKGKRKLQRKARKRGGKASKRGRSAEQIPVMVTRDRSGATLTEVAESERSRTPNSKEGGQQLDDCGQPVKAC